ncbi:MAG TPA: DUF6263 family protein [Niabella sp.]|nr:DUF6263 family protein [Niabella sp.]
MKSVFISIAVMLLLSCTAYGQKTYTLKFNPANGSKYEALTSMKTKTLQNVMGQEMEYNMDYDINMSYSITAEGANKRLNMTYDSLKMSMDVMGQTVNMDSNDTDSSNVANNAFKALKGQTVGVVLNPGGKVVKVDGFEELLQKSGEDEMQKQTLQGVLGEEAMKNLVEQSFGFYPEKPVKVGDSWTSTFTLKNPYIISATNTYTLTKVEGSKAIISTVSSLKTDSTSKMTSNNIEMLLDITGEVTGNTEVDIETGMPMITTVRQTLKGNIEVQGQKIPMASGIDTQITVTKK